MCIRDSSTLASSTRGLPWSRPSTRRSDEHLPPAIDRGDRCLLYTSDAADERSSVDLGGRRIIKKKKILEHNGRRDIWE